MSQGSDPAACEVAGTASTPRQARATAATAATSLREQAWRKRLAALIGEHPSCASVRNSRERCLLSRIFFTSVHVNIQSFADLHRPSRTLGTTTKLCSMSKLD